MLDFILLFIFLSVLGFANPTPQYLNDQENAAIPVDILDGSNDLVGLGSEYPENLSDDASSDTNMNDMGDGIIISDCSGSETQNQFDESAENNPFKSLVSRGQACPTRNHQTPENPPVPFGRQSKKVIPLFSKLKKTESQSGGAIITPCDQFGDKNILLTCAGPEAIYHGELTVMNCVPSMKNTVPTRGKLEGSDDVALYCCETFMYKHIPWAGDMCVRITWGFPIQRVTHEEFHQLLEKYNPSQ